MTKKLIRVIRREYRELLITLAAKYQLTPKRIKRIVANGTEQRSNDTLPTMYKKKEIQNKI